jgi:toxin YoeB
MGRYHLELKPSAKKEIQNHYKSGNKATIKKLRKILSELEVHPETGEGKPEQLKYELAGKEYGKRDCAGLYCEGVGED